MDKISNLELFKLYKSGNTEVRNILVEKNTSLVWSLVNRYQSTNVDKEDLFQIGCLGLINAIEKFDLSFNVQFSTYAVPIILGEIKKYFRDEGSIKVSRSLKELYYNIIEYKKEYYYMYNKEPHIDEIALKLNVSSQDIILSLEAHFYPRSLDEKIDKKDENSNQLKDIISSEDLFTKLDYICLEEAIKKLSKLEKTIIYLRYYEDYNQSDIAKRLGTSQVQVSRLEKKIIDKLKKEFV